MPGIPQLDPYPMPAEGDLPDNVVGWAADPRRAVLLVHDMQRYFVERFPAGTAPRDELVRNVRTLREAATARGMPVAYTAQPGGMSEADRGLLRDFWGPGMRIDPCHRQVVEELAPAPGDWVLTKYRYSAFHRSDLAGLLRRHGRDQLVVCGVYAHIGVLATAVDAFSRDVQPFLVADAVADFSRSHHCGALRYAAACCAAVTTTKALLSQLDREEDR
ncbi:MAG TPA: isochorismatase family protein [Pilimelia sp.]|nr:isochorismatase family protein [Pilimelia sp.]